MDLRLTGVRGLAVLWVVVYHAHQHFTGSEWFPVLSAGYLGVPLFLMLSVSLLLKSLDRKPALGRYFKRRIRRIWPLYFISLLLVFVFLAPGHSLLTLLENLTFLGVWIHGVGTGYNYVFWTLQVEELAYLTYPLLHRLDLRGKRLVAASLILSSVSGIWLYPTAYLFLPLALASFGWGILIYTGDVRKYGRSSLWVLVILALFWPDTSPGWDLAVLVLPGLAWVVAKPPKPTEWWWVVALGEMSYSIYLIHKLLIVRMGWWSFPMILVSGLIMEGQRLKRSLALRADPGTVADRIAGLIRRCGDQGSWTRLVSRRAESLALWWR
jgi:peptidoglycan/LPS O-acetylase OafA/YrhL